MHDESCKAQDAFLFYVYTGICIMCMYNVYESSDRLRNLSGESDRDERACPPEGFFLTNVVMVFR